MTRVTGLYGHIQRNHTISQWIVTSFFAAACVCWVFCNVVYSVGLRGVFGEQFHAELVGGGGFVHTASGRTIHLHRNQPKGCREDFSLCEAMSDERPSFGQLLWLGLKNGATTLYVPLLIVGAWFVVFWYQNGAILSWTTGAMPLSRSHEKRLYNLVENLSIQCGQPMPRLEVVESQARNAYAAGLTPEKSVIGVTRGLIDTLNDSELEAVLAHEMTHIRNGDSCVMLLATVFVGMFEGLLWHFWSGVTGAHEKDYSNKVISFPGRVFFSVIFFLPLCLSFAACWVPSMVARAHLSRSREFLADAGAVELTKDANALVSALIKVTGYEVKLNVPDNMQALMIWSPASGMFATHPPVEERIAALRAHAGAHVPIPRRADGTVARPTLRGTQPTFGRRVSPLPKKA